MRLYLIRLLIAFGGALLAAMAVGRPYLVALRRLGLGQHIRTEGPETHQRKTGTPTLGGVIILTALAITLLAMGAVKGTLAWAFFITLGFGVLGLIDDLLAITAKRNMGLKARQKLFGQALLAGLVSLYAVKSGLGAGLPIPFFALNVDLGSVFLFLLSLVAIISASNGVNLADGLDGLAAGTVAVAAIAQTCLVVLFGQPGLAIFPAAIAGSCLGFLWFNAHPAGIFMGDTGSLALGAALGAAAVLSKTVFFLPIIAGIFVLETLSVILQVFSFQALGRRIFRMSPLHHHFELSGWAEEKVVVRFWLLGFLFGLAGILGAWPILKG